VLTELLRRPAEVRLYVLTAIVLVPSD